MLNYHFKEILYRFYYLLISFFLTFIFIYSYCEKIIIVLSPIELFFSNILNVYYSYINFSIFLSLTFNFLFILYNLFNYLSPALFYKELKIIKLNIIKGFIFYLIYLYFSFNFTYFIITSLFSLFKTNYFIINYDAKYLINLYNTILIFGFIYYIIIYLLLNNFKINYYRIYLYILLFLFLNLFINEFLFNIIFSIIIIINIESIIFLNILNKNYTRGFIT